MSSHPPGRLASDWDAAHKGNSQPCGGQYAARRAAVAFRFLLSQATKGHGVDCQPREPLDNTRTAKFSGDAGRGLRRFVKSDGRVALKNDANPAALGRQFWRETPSAPT